MRKNYFFNKKKQDLGAFGLKNEIFLVILRSK